MSSSNSYHNWDSREKKNKRLDSFYNHGFPHIPLHSEASIHRPNGDTFGTKIDSMGNLV